VTLTAGTRVGVYEITGSIGAGGMGEVYRARDPRLDRAVAIKVLPRLFAGDPERLARFGREARALAALNHPHIAQIYGVEESDGSPAIVMELVDGEDLAARLARGPIPWEEALPIARQLAEGLDAAHERGIVHRDLKPGNIKVGSDDRVKILDFGLAKATGAAESSADSPMNSPTFTSPATNFGVIIGTAAYMAPEQAKGRAVDKRADIWAFGCVLYEMLTGRSPFGAESIAETLGAIVSRDPDWTSLPPAVPSTISNLLRRCLVKDPKHRLRDIGEALYVLAQPHDSVQPFASIRVRSSGILWMGATALALAAAAAVVAWQLKPAPAIPLRRVELPAAIAGASSFAIAPDGSRIAYIAGGHLVVRDLSALEPRDLGIVPPNSEHVFWSPDSQTIGFVAEAAIRTIPAAGGPTFTVCQLPASRRVMGIAWRDDSTIAFSMWRDSLYTVPASGGSPAVLLAVDQKTEVDFHGVVRGPDGRLIVSTHVRADDSDRVELLDNGRRTILSADTGVRNFRYAPGRLVFLRREPNQGVWTLPFVAQPLDLSKAALVEANATEFDVSTEGTLLVRSQPPVRSSLVWVNRKGLSSTIPGAPITDLSPAISVSPDGTRAAFFAGPRGRSNLFVRELTTGVDTRLTLGPAGPARDTAGTWTEMLYPNWFPSGDRLVYVTGAVEGMKLVAQRADGAVGVSVLASAFFGRVSRDGRVLVWIADERGRGRIWYAALGPDGRPGEAKSLFPADDASDARWLDLSPDGRLLAYSVRQSDSSRTNVYLTEFPGGSTRWQVTTDGANSPRFSPDGRELFFLSGTRTASGAPVGRLMVMPLTLQPSVKLGVSTPILEAGTAADADGFDVARDGRVLIRRRTATPGEAAGAVLVQNWPAALAAR
jgi:Tol biopolymer transport system component